MFVIVLNVSGLFFIKHFIQFVVFVKVLWKRCYTNKVIIIIYEFYYTKLSNEITLLTQYFIDCSVAKGYYSLLSILLLLRPAQPSPTGKDTSLIVCEK